MNEQLKFLVELQEIDSAILSIDEKIELLPNKIKQFEIPLKEANHLFQKSKSGYESLNKKKKDKDLQLEEFQDKIDKLKSRSSEIKTNKEYEAHLKEIEGIEKRKYEIEDEILAMMEEIENYTNDLQKEEAMVRKAESEFKQQEKTLEEETRKLRSEMDMYKAKRKDFASRIDEEHYSQYMKLLERMGGLAVVPTQNEVCLGCNTNIPPQLYNDIRKNEDIFTCYYCKRFMYFKEPASPDNKSQQAPPAS